MHAGSIERIISARNAQKAGALFECFWPQTRHILERLSRAERAVGVAVQHDILRQSRADTRYACQQRRRGGVGINADRVHAIFDDRIKRTGQLLLAQVMLVLSDADGFWIDLDEFSKRIL